MFPRRMVLGCAAIAAVAAVAAGQEPAQAPEAEELTAAELSGIIARLSKELPSVSIKSPPVTKQLQAKAEKACEVFRKAQPRAKELDLQTQLSLSTVGARAGFLAGEPKVMLSGARLRWSLEQPEPSNAAAYALAWAGIFAGDRQAAIQGLKHLLKDPAKKSLVAWAKEMQPIAEQCGQPPKGQFTLLIGARSDFARLRGKAVVLSFWSLSNKEAVAAIPQLNEFLKERRRDHNFMLLGMALETKRDEVWEAVRKRGISWPQALDQGLRSKFLGTDLPHVVVISPAGHVIWQGHPKDKDTMTWVTDFARRQSARMNAQLGPPGRFRPPVRPTARQRPKAQPSGKPTQAQQAQAEQKYKMYLAYRKVRARSKAKAILQEIVQQYPGTTAAAKASQELRHYR